MTKRFLGATASVFALGLIGAASLGIGGEAARETTAPIEIAAAQGTAPDFTGIGKWYNSAPLNIADLRGKVVLVNFWTYGCVNCINALPHVVALNEKYKDRGLVVVGVHTPEFPFERSAANVQSALKRHGITYPVAQDNDFQNLERLAQPVLASAVHYRPERKDRVPACRRRPVRADRQHRRAAVERQQLRRPAKRAAASCKGAAREPAIRLFAISVSPIAWYSGRTIQP